MKRRALFLDKDGTLIENIPYNVNPDTMHLLPGTIAGLQLLQASGYCLVVVSNQSGVARGLFSFQALLAVEERLRTLLAVSDVFLDACYFCPHLPAGVVPDYAVECNCRKPLPGMLLQAAADLSFDLTQSWMVGDSFSDIEAGQRAGCRTILLTSTHDAIPPDSPRPDSLVRDLTEAARFILGQDPFSARSAFSSPPLSYPFAG